MFSSYNYFNFSVTFIEIKFTALFVKIHEKLYSMKLLMLFKIICQQIILHDYIYLFYNGKCLQHLL